MSVFAELCTGAWRTRVRIRVATRTLVSAMAAGWTAEETRALVSVWSQTNVKNQLDGVTRNRIVFEKIAKEMAELGFERTWQQCRTKVKNLTQKYRKVNS